MTIKNLYPHMTNWHRKLLGLRFIASYINLHKSRPPKVSEDSMMVCDYPQVFISSRVPAIIKRFLKEYPTADVRPPERKKRPRIIVNAKRVN